MNIRRMVLTIAILAGLPAAVAHTDKLPLFGAHTREQFQDYWYNHGAEISRFSLRQMRYGEIHEGDAVLVFVTEKMNPDTQIKADHPGAQDIPILKLNAVRKFFTGIYPYSIMTSIFAPVDVQKYPLPLKVSSSTQEWCGHVYTQMNLNENEYRVRLHSYFEKDFPHRIQKWHETYRGLISMGAKVLTTSAARTHTIMDAYWKHHTNNDRRRLEGLGLSAREMGGD
jgi:hypothetical protein